MRQLGARVETPGEKAQKVRPKINKTAQWLDRTAFVCWPIYAHLEHALLSTRASNAVLTNGNIPTGRSPVWCKSGCQKFSKGQLQGRIDFST